MVAAKNLFSQDRNDPTEEIAKVQDSLEGRQLLGTMIIGDTKAAIIGGKPTGRGNGTPEVEVVHQGEEWDGFKVLEISNESVVLQGKTAKKP